MATNDKLLAALATSNDWRIRTSCYWFYNAHAIESKTAKAANLIFQHDRQARLSRLL